MRPGTITVTLDGRPITHLAAAQWTITWQHEARQHAAAGRITGTILDSPDLRLRYESELRITAVGDDGRTLTLARGWIDAWSRRRSSAGRWIYHIEAGDIIARAAATRIAARPWPRQSSTARQHAINNASPIGPIVAVWATDWTVGARDTDNRTALELLQASCRPDVTVAASTYGIQLRPAHGPLLRVDGLGLRIIRPIVALPAAAVYDADRYLDRRALLTSITITAPNPVDPTRDSRRTYTQPHCTTTTSSLAITTDWIATNDQADVTIWATRVLEGAATPTERLTTTRLRTDQLAPATLDRLLDLDARDGTLVRILDAPADLPALWTVASGTITLEATDNDLEIVLEIDLEPPAWSGLLPARWRDWPTAMGRYLDAIDLRINDLDAITQANDWLGTTPTRWSDLPNTARYTTAPTIRLLDLETVTTGD